MTPEGGDFRKTICYDNDARISNIDIGEIIRRHPKNSTPFEGNFGLRQLSKKGNHTYGSLGELNNSSGLYMDGRSGFVVQATTEQGDLVNVCVVSYEPSRLYWDYTSDTDPRNFPRIVQMQGCTQPGDGKRRRGIVMRALSTFSVEDVCVDIVIEQGRREAAPAVGILPASNNPNSHRKKFSLERATVRYDQTAERRGFKRQPSGLYIFELTPAQLPFH